MRLVFYPPQDNLDLWSRRSSGPQFCHSSCSWRHSRHPAPPESSSRRWIPRRWDTPARCNRAPSCRSQTGRECGQTDPGGYLEHGLTEQSLDILFGWSTLKWEMMLVPSTTVTVRAIPVENTVRERVLIFLITVILRPRLTPVFFLPSAPAVPRLMSLSSVSHCQGQILQRWSEGNKNWFPWLQDLQCYHHWGEGDGIIIIPLL